MIRISDRCAMFLTPVPRSRVRRSVKIVFVLLEDHHFPIRENTGNYIRRDSKNHEILLTKLEFYWYPLYC